MPYIHRSDAGKQFCVAVFDNVDEAKEALPVIKKSDPDGHYYVTSTPTPMQELIETLSKVSK